jgi:hypothetical protein
MITVGNSDHGGWTPLAECLWNLAAVLCVSKLLSNPSTRFGAVPPSGSVLDSWGLKNLLS